MILSECEFRLDPKTSFSKIYTLQSRTGWKVDRHLLHILVKVPTWGNSIQLSQSSLIDW